MGHLKGDDSDNKYSVMLVLVQDALFEKQEQEEQPQLLLEQEDRNMVSSLSISFHMYRSCS
jgi:hypothetical protein